MKNILNYNNFLFEYLSKDELKYAKEVLPKQKLKHSKRVAEYTKEIKDDKDVYNASVYHDFIERGGNYEDCGKILSPYALKLVKCLTNNDDTDTLLKLKMVLSGCDNKTKNDVLIIKIADRADNLNKRLDKDNLNKKYLNKSIELIQYIWDNYTDDKTKLFRFINVNIIRKIPFFKEKIHLY